MLKLPVHFISGDASLIPQGLQPLQAEWQKAQSIQQKSVKRQAAHPQHSLPTDHVKP
jgi:hypothetical protein